MASQGSGLSRQGRTRKPGTDRVPSPIFPSDRCALERLLHSLIHGLMCEVTATGFSVCETLGVGLCDYIRLVLQLIVIMLWINIIVRLSGGVRPLQKQPEPTPALWWHCGARPPPGGHHFPDITNWIVRLQNRAILAVLPGLDCQNRTTGWDLNQTNFHKENWSINIVR